MLLGSRIGVVFGLAFGLLSGCYSEPDIDKIVCRGPAYECPDGYVCRVAADGGDGRGRCCKPGDPLCGSRAVDASPSDLSSEAAQPLDGSMKTDEMIDHPAAQTLDGALSVDVATSLDSTLVADTSATFQQSMWHRTVPQSPPWMRQPIRARDRKRR